MVKIKELIESTRLQKKIQQEIEANRKKKVAILFKGESYRDCINFGNFNAGTNSRNTGNLYTINDQRIANYNHCEFILHVKNKYNIDIDLFIDTQTTKYDYYLMTDYYRNYSFDCTKINFKSFTFHDSYCKTQMLSTQRAVNSILNNDINKYESVLILRNDLFLKDKFFDLYNPFHDKVYFSFIIWNRHRGRTLGDFPRISDVIYHIPKKYFLLLKHFKSVNPPNSQKVPDANIYADDPISGGWGHEAIYYWNQIIPNFQYDFYVKTFHESNPAEDLNPIYHMVNRKIADKHITRQDKVYPDNFNEDF